MNTTQAIDQLKPESWANTSIAERLQLLQAVRENLKKYTVELASKDAEMKNSLIGEDIYGVGFSKLVTAVPVGATLAAATKLYESLAKGEMLDPVGVDKLSADEHRVQVYPTSAIDKVMAGAQKGYLHIKGELKQTNPMDKPAGIIGIIGAGNYSSSAEMVKAMFFDNKTVAHKPNKLNLETEKVWEKIFQPLVDAGALSFCGAGSGSELTKDKRLTAIYFTGGAETAQTIMSATDTPLISECGGNNPCLIVPGDVPWTDKEMEHQALQIATMSKLNGGAVCGRPQTIITSKHWSQREQFLKALRKALQEDTPATGTYYPGSDEIRESFTQAYPNAESIEPEAGKYKNGQYILITDIEADGYAVQNEAFCQIMGEVALDVPANAADYLPAAVKFCNTQLLGTLAANILIDEKSKKTHQKHVDQAVMDLNYGGISVNAMAAFIFFNPSLTWGGNEEREGEPFVSGHGNFGNLLGYENIEKSVLVDAFMSPAHVLHTSNEKMEILFDVLTRFNLEPSWPNLLRFFAGAIKSGFKKKDF